MATSISDKQTVIPRTIGETATTSKVRDKNVAKVEAKKAPKIVADAGVPKAAPSGLTQTTAATRVLKMAALDPKQPA
ncbi:MAG TPA: hypothetical protein VGO62_03755, partial [Myxococcota bacterium]